MSQIGKAMRLERIMNRETGKTIIVPMDHGVSMGPIKGLINMTEMVNKVAEGGANAVIGLNSPTTFLIKAPLTCIRYVMSMESPN